MQVPLRGISSGASSVSAACSMSAAIPPLLQAETLEVALSHLLVGKQRGRRAGDVEQAAGLALLGTE